MLIHQLLTPLKIKYKFIQTLPGDLQFCEIPFVKLNYSKTCRKVRAHIQGHRVQRCFLTELIFANIGALGGCVRQLEQAVDATRKTFKTRARRHLRNNLKNALQMESPALAEAFKDPKIPLGGVHERYENILSGIFHAAANPMTKLLECTKD